MEICMKAKPFAYAGKPVREADQKYNIETIEACDRNAQEVEMDDGNFYLCAAGRYVPYYHFVPYKGTDDGADFRYSVVNDFTRKFFHNADAGIQIKRSHNQIKELAERIKLSPEGSEQRTAYTELYLGACVQRLDRLADEMLGNPHSEIPLEPGAPKLRVEFNSLLSKLRTGQNLFATVRRRNGEADIDNVLYGLIEEIQHAATLPIQQYKARRCFKIAEATNDIDAIAQAADSLIESSSILSKSPLADQLTRFANAAMQRVGIRGSDISNYADSHAELLTAQRQLEQSLLAVVSGRHVSGRQAAASDAAYVEEAIDLIKDITQLRLPRHESTRLFVDAVDQQLEKRQSVVGK